MQPTSLTCTFALRQRSAPKVPYQDDDGAERSQREVGQDRTQEQQYADDAGNADEGVQLGAAACCLAEGRSQRQ
jgi:hypothetical protein